ncbi:hypothetical protein T439DRAFT_327582 [Meredithblackwellia eburnea MCA 4105]
MTQGVELLNPQDFDGLTYASANRVWTNDSVADVFSSVDGLNSTLGQGITPALYQINNYRSTLKRASDSNLGAEFGYIITNSSTNEYTLTAPVAKANTTCIDLTLDSTTYFPMFYAPDSSLTSNARFVYEAVFDENCNDLGNGQITGSRIVFAANHPKGIVGTITCMNNSQAYTSYYLVKTPVNTATGNLTFFPLASCRTNVMVGDGINIKYYDLNTSYVLPGSEAKKPFSILAGNTTDATALANELVQSWWTNITSTSTTGSYGMLYFVTAIISLNTWDFKTPMEHFTQALYSMAVAKKINAETYYAVGESMSSIAGQSVQLSAYTNTVASDALVVGPSGYSALYLVVMGLQLLALVICVALAIRFPPVSLNPLDPVSVLLVAQNSPPSIMADGGCLGDVDQVRSAGAKITYRAVNNQHLGFVFGPSYYEAPKFGRMYGSISAETEKKEV